MKVFHRFLLTVFIPGLFLSGFPLLANNVNPTAPIEALKHWHNDFTDTDGDGMTDVAELKYGFNPNDASSFPSKDYTLLDDAPEEDYPQHESNGIFDPNNEWVFVFHPSDYTKWFTEENKANPFRSFTSIISLSPFTSFLFCAGPINQKSG